MIVPIPKSVAVGSGQMTLGAQIVADSPALVPLANIVAEEIQLLTGRILSVTNRTPRPGDIVLATESALKGEAYSVEVKDIATVRGGDSDAVALGTVSLLQSMDKSDAGIAIPQISVHDSPAAGYRGLMIDVARNPHSLKTLKQAVVLCRWYKIRYLQLHLTDNESFTFPSTAYPQLGSVDCDRQGRRHFSLAELRELEAYASARGVAIVPEMETPGHGAAMIRGMPEVFGPGGNNHQAICVGRESVYEVLGTLVGEMCEVFRTSAYFHIGADEVTFEDWDNCPDTKAYMTAHKLENTAELYRHFLVRMNEIVKKHGKKTIVWEGFAKAGCVEIPRDITVMVFECMYHLPPDLLAAGYPVINASWQPLYVVGDWKSWMPDKIYDWNMYRWENWFEKSAAAKKPITVEPTNLVLGAQMCAWAQSDDVELPSLRHRVPAMSERIWNPDAGRTFADFSARARACDAKLSQLLQSGIEDVPVRQGRNDARDAAATINARDYGAIPDDGKNDLDALRKAVAAAVQKKNCRLIIPPGLYELSDEQAIKLQEEALSGKMGNPQDRLFNRDYHYVTALDFTGAENVTVEAKGAEFLMNGWMEPVSLQKCSGVTINGLTVDYRRPPNSEGRIIAVGNGTVDVRFEDWCPVTQELPFIRLMVYDEATASLCGASFDHCGQKLIAPHTMRFTLTNSQCQVGRVFLGWHSFHFRPVILIYESRNIVLNDVTLHANHGMGIVGHLSENITMNRVRIVPRAGRHISTNTDATHFVSCRGLIRFDRCEFGGQGDDATNVHCIYTDILSTLAGNRCVLATSRSFETHSVKRDYPQAGDTLAVVRRSTLEEVGYIRVTSVELSSKDWAYTISYEGKLPDDIGNYSVANITASPALEFLNCKVRSHRARAVLVKTRKVLIEGCTFENTTGTAIHIGAEGNWMEGVASADVVVRGNRITHCGLGGDGDGTIDGASAIAVQVNASDQSVPGLHKRLLFENNEITGGRHAISIRGAEDVTVRHNLFREIREAPIMVATSRRVWATDNQGAVDFKADEAPSLPAAVAAL